MRKSSNNPKTNAFWNKPIYIVYENFPALVKLALERKKPYVMVKRERFRQYCLKQKRGKSNNQKIQEELERLIKLEILYGNQISTLQMKQDDIKDKIVNLRRKLRSLNKN